jgi:hypothetical protein
MNRSASTEDNRGLTPYIERSAKAIGEARIAQMGYIHFLMQANRQIVYLY